MNNMNENKQSETSAMVFDKELLRSLKLDLEDVLEKIRTVWVDVDQQDRLSLDMAEEHIEEIYDKVRERLEIEDAQTECDRLVKSIAGD
jgi:hypothetical protein